ADTSVNGYTTYNAIHWDGQKWELKKIYTYSPCSSVDYADLRAIYAFSENNIVVSSGGGMWWFNGNRWKSECSINPLLTGVIEKLWGTSSSNLYAVGYNGNIAHWDGKRWSKIESGVDVNLIDIHGQTTDGKIFICGYNIVNIYKATLLEMKDKEVKVKWYKTNLFNYDPPYGGTVHNIYTFGDYLFTVGSRGFFKENVRLGTYPKKVEDYALDWVYAMRGNDINDIYTFSDQNEIYHFNGINLRKIYGNNLILHAFYGGAVKGDVVVGVGFIYVSPVFTIALIVMGKRN
ncbi:MAG: hypothetical protein ACPL1B_09820, partial [Thermoprotei archaeon]